MAQKILGQIDMQSGEIMTDGFVAYVVPKRKNGFQVEGWFAMSNEAMTLLKKFNRLEDFKVLMAMLERLDYENLITVSQAEIAKDLEMKRQNVNAAVKRLIEVGAILEGPKIGINRSYRLNPKFGWKGSAKNHVLALADYRKNQDQKIPPNL